MKQSARQECILTSTAMAGESGREEAMRSLPGMEEGVGIGAVAALLSFRGEPVLTEETRRGGEEGVAMMSAACPSSPAEVTVRPLSCSSPL